MSVRYIFVIVVTFACILFVTSCAPDPVVSLENGSVEMVSDTQVWQQQRPLPREIKPPDGFLKSVDEGIRTGDGRPGEQYWQQFAQYDIDATLIPVDRQLAATVRITYHNNSPDTLRRLQLEMVQNLHAEGVRRNRPVEVTGGVSIRQVSVGGMELTDEPDRDSFYAVQGTRMVLHPPAKLVPGEFVDIEIAYDFSIPQQGAGGRMGYSGDNLYYLGYWYPQMVVYDDVVGWHPDSYLGQAEFYHGFADYKLTIRAPEEWLVMATGELQNANEVLAPDVYRRWREAGRSDEPVRVFSAGSGRLPTLRGVPGRTRYARDSAGGEISWVEETGDEGAERYLAWRFSAENVRDVAFSATKASNWDAARTAVGDLTGDGETDYTLINSFWREEAPLWTEVVAYQQHAITFLSEMTGFPYPWPHMTAVEGAGIIGGGMEYPMMTLMGDYNQRGAEALYSVTAHELAHMWVPLIVSTDERRYSWLDEGNTVFSTAEAVGDFLPERRQHRQSQNAYIRAARRGDEGPIMRRSDFHYTTAHFRMASYQKPAAVLVALRKVLGDDLFEEAYQTFINDWAFKQAYPWDFFRTIERVSGRDLDWFWYSWYYETWVLNQAIDQVHETTDGTRIVIRDEGEVPMPVYLTVTSEEGQTRRTIPETVWLEGRRSTEITIPERNVTRVVIDAERALPDINRQNAVWERP
ncbi:M1 family metallopeptidase [Balneolales bacterium ANBcel1]|nr:M1 family metallopeptidase [Balneolales bacterium ANBcel1]